MNITSRLEEELSHSIEVGVFDEQDREGYLKCYVGYEDGQYEYVSDELIALGETGVEIDGEVREVIPIKNAEGDVIYGMNEGCHIYVEKGTSKIEEYGGGSPQ